MCSGARREDCKKLLLRLQLAQQSQQNRQSLHPVQQSSKHASSKGRQKEGLPQYFLMPPVWPTQTPEALLAVQTNKCEGGKLVAAMGVHAGSLLWVERPFAHVLLKQHRKQVLKCLLMLAHRQAANPFCLQPLSSMLLQLIDSFWSDLHARQAQGASCFNIVAASCLQPSLSLMNTL